MTTLAAKAAMNYSNMNKKGVWRRFKNYLTENQQTIMTGMAMISGNSNYAYSKTLGK